MDSLYFSSFIMYLHFQVIKKAFQCFDEDNSGTISVKRLRELLTTMGDRYTEDQVMLVNVVPILK
jgi:Ca2+-binding EF-hand superfamily protein